MALMRAVAWGRRTTPSLLRRFERPFEKRAGDLGFIRGAEITEMMVGAPNGRVAIESGEYIGE